jgi:isopentenyl-diphosphate Delta-isomerase
MANELIVYVDENGRPTGETAEKLAGHTGSTKRHLGFSCYVFNSRGQLLLTQRAFVKKVWPGVWTNTVCGHPSPNESTLEAIKRRLKFELGTEATNYTEVISDYKYTTPPYQGIIENEFCPVYFAISDSDPKPNTNEVAAWRWVSWHDFVVAADADRQDEYSYWCKDQLTSLKNHPELKRFARL